MRALLAALLALILVLTVSGEAAAVSRYPTRIGQGTYYPGSARNSSAGRATLRFPNYNRYGWWY